MTEFYIELSEGLGGDIAYRLQTDKQTWRRVDSRELHPTDFLTHDFYEIIKLQREDWEINLEGETWKVNTGSYFLGDRTQLRYDVYVNRNIIPPIPSSEQLTSIIKQGDDRENNSLILNINGFFELRQFFNLSIEDPTIVVRNETFSAGCGCVGEGAADPEFIAGLYADCLDYWLSHLKTGQVGFYSDIETRKKTSDILEEIEQFMMEVAQKEEGVS